MASYYIMNVMVKKATIFPNNVQSGITLTQRKDGSDGVSFAVSTVGKRYTLDSIRKAQQLFSNTLNVQREQLRFIHQIHSDVIQIVEKNTEIPSGDAFITKSKEIVLCISVADCVGITLYDPMNELIAGIHSGWRGTSKNIVSKTIETMKNEFGTEGKNVLAYVSPSASQQLYEVQEDVSSLFESKYVNIVDSKKFLDVAANVVDQLKEMGIESKNIERDHTCTISNEQFHSYRREGNLFGLNVVYISQILN